MGQSNSKKKHDIFYNKLVSFLMPLGSFDTVKRYEVDEKGKRNSRYAKIILNKSSDDFNKNYIDINRYLQSNRSSYWKIEVITVSDN